MGQRNKIRFEALQRNDIKICRNITLIRNSHNMFNIQA